jgi:TolB protein
MKIFFFNFITLHALIIGNSTIDDGLINGFNIEIIGKSTTKTPLYIHHVTPHTPLKKPFALEIVQKDLLFLDQFSLVTISSSKILTKEERKMLCHEGYSFAIFILDKKNTVDIYVHDLFTDQTIIGKRVVKNNNERSTAHKISDIIVEGLTMQPGFFSTYIAYAKEKLVPPHLYRSTKLICIAEYDGSHEYVLVDRPDLVFGLRWHNTLHKPLLFYSQHTKTNIQLRSVNQFKKTQLISDVDGITMLPTFMPNNKGIIVSATDNNGFAQLYHYTLQGVIQLTSYEGNSIAPSFSCNDNMLYFCSDFKNNSPHIFVYDMFTKKIDEITKDGYCTSPIISHEGRILAYTKLVKGIMQIFLYDTQTKIHRQITFDATNKDSYSWSPCSTYLLYGESKNKMQRIIFFNIINGNKKYITQPEFRCSSPAWSPIYKDFPLLVT